MPSKRTTARCRGRLYDVLKTYKGNERLVDIVMKAIEAEPYSDTSEEFKARHLREKMNLNFTLLLFAEQYLKKSREEIVHMIKLGLFNAESSVTGLYTYESRKTEKTYKARFEGRELRN